MAIMIPEKPHVFEAASQEGLIFDALEKLPDDYYVFHSFRITTVKDNIIHESETDFVIFNRKKGIICLEAKAGRVKYKDGYWYYGNDLPMHNGGPFNQADANKWKLQKYFEEKNLGNILEHCKFLHAVWFPSLSDEQVRKMSLPSEAAVELILTKDALSDPRPYIETIFETKLPNGIETDVSEQDTKRIIRDVLCPQFDVFPTTSLEADLKKTAFHRLLREQAGILNFLGEQRTAVINGAAGTGKTMIAVEKAFRHASDKEKVLFLCYNSQLKDYLSDNYKSEYVDFYTIAGFACKVCNTETPDYDLLKEKLEDYYLAESFPYKHVIVDEGQDFGMEMIEEADLLGSIRDIIADNEQLNGTFYVFYDKLQLIQAKNNPQFIEEADCKLTLYRNCRNTVNIATTSLKPITERSPKLADGCVEGAPTRVTFCESDKSAVGQLDKLITKLKEEGYRDIVILTCGTEETSAFFEYIKDGKYKNKTKFTTCRKFKGLEADVIILVDVNKDTFCDDNVLLFYVGASRARIQLDILTTMSESDCVDVLKNNLHVEGKIRKGRRDLAKALKARALLEE